MTNKEFDLKFNRLVEKHTKEDLNPWYKNPLSIQIIEKKYLYPEEKSPIDMIFRVSKTMQDKNLGLKLAELMLSGSFFPGGRSLYGLGSKGRFKATTSNCYTCQSPEDSLDSIYESNKEIAKIFKSGGGIGINLSELRPNGAKTNNAARTSTGAVSFVHLYNATGSIIGFHGRRGAMLVGLNISHPDIEEFINLRKDHDLSAMNISTIIDDEFMEAVIDRKPYKLHFHVKDTGEDIEKLVNSYELFENLCYMAWDYGDPGILYKNVMDNHNLMSHTDGFKIDICNPCAEYLGPAYSSCNLGSMNLYNYVKDKFTSGSKFDYTSFKRDIRTAVRVLDEILDYGYELQPLDKNREVIDKWRPIGLGFFGFADALVGLGIKYGSKESINFASKICMTLMDTAIRESSVIAAKKGSFKNFDKEALLKSEIIRELSEKYKGIDVFYKNINYLRNGQLISIAPTGSLSLIAGQLSSGIEPIFKCVYERTTHQLESKNVFFQVADRAVSDLLEINGDSGLSSEEIKKKYPWIVEAKDINPIDRLKIQSAMQHEIDNAISSTVNLPEDTTVEEVIDIFINAWKLKLKGITVFRDNCKRATILGFNDKKEDKDIVMDSLEPLSRKNTGPLNGRTYRKQTACVRALYVTVNRDENDNIFEVFTNKSIHGCSANIATITRMTSLALRSGINVNYIIKELKENTCQACQALRKKNTDVSLSCPYAIAEAIEEEYNLYHSKANKVAKKIESKKDQIIDNALECPDCHERALITEGRCVTCKRCGYSRCD